MPSTMTILRCLSEVFSIAEVVEVRFLDGERVGYAPVQAHPRHLQRERTELAFAPDEADRSLASGAASCGCELVRRYGGDPAAPRCGVAERPMAEVPHA